MPTGTPGRATFGFKLTQVDFKVNNVFTSPGSSVLRWRVLATPYTPNTGRANPAGSVEAQSVVAFPRVVSLRKPAVQGVQGHGDGDDRWGRAAAGRRGDDAPALPRQVRRRRRAPSVTLRHSGAGFSGAVRIRQTAKPQVLFVQVRATLAAGTTTCTPTFGVPCLSATRAATIVRSNTVRVVIPARKK